MRLEWLSRALSRGEKLNYLGIGLSGALGALLFGPAGGGILAFLYVMLTVRLPAGEFDRVATLATLCQLLVGIALWLAGDRIVQFYPEAFVSFMGRHFDIINQVGADAERGRGLGPHFVKLFLSAAIVIAVISTLIAPFRKNSAVYKNIEKQESEWGWVVASIMAVTMPPLGAMLSYNICFSHEFLGKNLYVQFLASAPGVVRWTFFFGVFVVMIEVAITSVFRLLSKIYETWSGK